MAGEPDFSGDFELSLVSPEFKLQDSIGERLFKSVLIFLGEDIKNVNVPILKEGIKRIANNLLKLCACGELFSLPARSG